MRSLICRMIGQPIPLLHFYHLSWMDVSIAAFIQIIDDYMIWYRKERIKISLGGMSPLEYRQNVGLCS